VWQLGFMNHENCAMGLCVMGDGGVCEEIVFHKNSYFEIQQ